MAYKRLAAEIRNPAWASWAVRGVEQEHRRGSPALVASANSSSAYDTAWPGYRGAVASWADRQPGPNRSRSRTTVNADAIGLRFAFYGRMSTEDFQDEASSRAWQRQAAGELVAGYGRIVAEYFDVRCSRRVAWTDRPRAAALLAALADSGRGVRRGRGW